MDRTSCVAQGELLIKDGLYMTEEATVFDLEGVYVAATGQLHVQAAPAGGPLRLPLNDSDAGAIEHLPEYRYLASKPPDARSLQTRQTHAMPDSSAFPQPFCQAACRVSC